MAVKLTALGLPFGKGKQEAKPAEKKAPATRLAKAPAQGAVANRISDAAGRGISAKLPVIGALPMQRQVQVFLAIFAVFVAIAVFLVFVQLQGAAEGTARITATGELQVLSQRIASDSQQGLQGNAAAFARLRDARERFGKLTGTLLDGGEVGGVRIDAAGGGVRSAVESVKKLWDATDGKAALVIGQEKSLVSLGTAVKTINADNPALLDLAEQVAALKLQTQSSSREISIAGQLVMLTQRIAKNANTLLASDVVDPEVTFLLGKDANTFRDLLQGLIKGSDALRVSASRDPETVEKLKELEAAYAKYRESVNAILGNLNSLVKAKAAGSDIVKGSPALLQAVNDLQTTFQAQRPDQTIFFVAIAISALLALGALGLIAKAYLDDNRRRREESERLREEAERLNKTNQEAILRLMNEMGSLADGDLTVQATVTEDVTGAIADSVNYTIEELKGLVGRINSAAAQVTNATEFAQQTSVKLLQAAEKQSREIQEASASVLKMARAINEVSASASKSVSVARQSLGAAQKGQEAVQNSIAGMNDIREQIQDTAKRIKRLGESSQQIGEIVELISDITEQTNVLALNAAIQAASAGEAGRGFTVVAEEVQRLAERSGEATKQIGAIVKTIQTDTGDAVAAMEKSTQGVVDGARLSDNAGQALSEIGEVSRRLAQLIEEISVTAQAQAQAAGVVATSMQDILNITRQTTEGTKQTAVSIGQLAKLAQELKGSVANFKLQ
ncbi:MAG: type IV pili methyl-accepting chemotaxis transducer N-terminal domain-containing protein [Burkholderiales bacterium]|nr:type IV pili methyl-accepting chemotaxis transducer N-terminal domain-containing protein [Burkholderiales bacterium]